MPMCLDTLRSIKNRAHAYDVEVNSAGDYVRVECANRAQAEAIARRAGWEVRSVNMVG